jgi:hypothetical protein
MRAVEPGRDGATDGPAPPSRAAPRRSFSPAAILQSRAAFSLATVDAFFELRDGTEHLMHQHRSRRVLSEEVRRRRRDQRDAKLLQVIMAGGCTAKSLAKRSVLSTMMVRTPLPAILSSGVTQPAFRRTADKVPPTEVAGRVGAATASR